VRQEITVEKIRKEYQKMLDYNTGINLDETVKVNENFFIGKQWEGVQANGLPTPVFNFIKRVVLFCVASITTDNVKMQASPMSAAVDQKAAGRMSDVANRVFERLFAFNAIPDLMREYMRNAAVDGDSCLYTYWDDTANVGNDQPGEIRTEILGNTHVGFGNAADRNVQSQPYILIESRRMTDELKKYAKAHGCSGVDEIVPDNSNHDEDSYKNTDDKTTVIMRLWKDEETGNVWACEATEKVIIREPWDLNLKLYPITWINWDYVQDSYHGVGMVTGLIPNQIFVNKLYAMSMLSLMTTAYPKIVFDKTRVGKWDNRIGAAIGINGGDVNNVARIIDPAHIDPQISQFINMVVEMTQTNLGATSVALGDTRPDNTSAIIALQRAASTPQEITRQNLFRSIKELGRIYLDFMAGYYGERMMLLPVPEDAGDEVLAFAGMKQGEMIPVPFDFATLANTPMDLKLDVGASSYWSETAAMQTLDNLLMQKQINIVEYLERLPAGYVPKLQELIENKKKEMAAMQMQAMAQAAPDGGNPAPDVGGILPPGSMPVPTGGGYGELQRAINRTGEVPA